MRPRLKCDFHIESLISLICVNSASVQFPKIHPENFHRQVIISSLRFALHSLFTFRLISFLGRGLKGQRGSPATLLRQHIQPIGADCVLRLAIEHCLSIFQEDAAVAIFEQDVVRMGYQQNGNTLLLHLANAVQTFLLEGGIAHRKRLIHDQNIRVNIDGGGKGNAHIHAAGIGLHRLVNKLSDVGKGDNPSDAFLDLIPAHAEDGGVRINVFASAKLGVETRAQLQQGGNPSVDLDSAKSRGERSGDQLQECGFSASVPPDNADRLTLAHIEGNITQRPKFMVIVAVWFTQQPVQARVDKLLQAVFGAVV
ncbi:MAG: hypothetical protein KPEEDBHJ_01096 [Anaerolineales bacterium]|nr:hypothetical protein [Anaerolineales bacterium]